MNHPAQVYYHDQQQRSLSSTTQLQQAYPGIAAPQYTSYQSGHSASSSSYASQGYYTPNDAQSMAYATHQQTGYVAQMPTSHPMVNSASYPGGTSKSLHHLFHII